MLDAYEVWPTLDFHIRFIRPIRVDDVVRVESNVVNRGKMNAVVETTFENSERKVLARVTDGWAKAGRERTW
jgi:acyl-coenzyme A thioesterase PaaI-like protein